MRERSRIPGLTVQLLSSSLLGLLTLGLAGFSAPESAADVPAHTLQLPATFRGVLPCGDCGGVRYHLDLWADGVFHLRREWLDPKAITRDDIGRWSIDPTRETLLLRGGAEMPLQFAILGPRRLRALDMSGSGIDSKLPYDLESDGTLSPTAVALTLGGEMHYMADAATFVECLTGRRYPIAMEGAFRDLQAGYREAVSEPGAALYVTFDGSIVERPKMEGTGIQPTVVVTRFIKAWPGQTCKHRR